MTCSGLVSDPQIADRRPQSHEHDHDPPPRRARKQTDTEHPQPHRAGGVEHPGARWAAGDPPRVLGPLGPTRARAGPRPPVRHRHADRHHPRPEAGSWSWTRSPRPGRRRAADRRPADARDDRVDFLAGLTSASGGQRMLLVTRDYTSANPIIPAMTLGQSTTTSSAAAPGSRALSRCQRSARELGGIDGREQLHLLRIVAPENSARAHESAYPTRSRAYAFHTTDSDEDKRCSTRRGQPG